MLPSRTQTTNLVADDSRAADQLGQEAPLPLLTIPNGVSQVLVVDSDDVVRELVQYSLERDGHVVVAVQDGRAAAKAFGAHTFDMAILDANTPIIDGWSLCKQFQQQKNVCILILSESSDPADQVQAFTIGATYYMVKPFSMRELRARVKAGLRRQRYKRVQSNDHVLSCGEILLDKVTCEVVVRRSAVGLTPTEFLLLKYLLEHPDEIISKETLSSAVWEYQYDRDGNANFISTAIHRLRHKIEIQPSDPLHLRTIRGEGYVLTNCRLSQNSQGRAASPPDMV